MKIKAAKGSVSLVDTVKKLTVVSAYNDESSTVSNDLPIHHIQIIDRSGSMYGEIGKLIENVKQTLNLMKEDDLFSIIWFASHEQFRTLIKGASIKGNRSAYNDLLDSIKSVLGCTCFSDPVREARDIVNELKGLCPNFSITLFTDGAPVCPWSNDEEDSKVTELIKEMKNDIIAFNTIGYGNYYNAELLRKWSNESDYGTMTHSSNINEYFDIFDSVIEEINGIKRREIKVSADNSKIFHVSRRNVKMYENESDIKFSGTDGVDRFIIMSDSFDDFKINVEYENDDGSKVCEVIDTKSLKSIITNETPYVYRMAYGAYSAGMDFRALSRDLLYSVGDKPLIDDHINSFSNNEVGNHIKLLKKAAFGTTGRNPGTAPDGYIPSTNQPCVVDILNFISKNDIKIIPDLMSYNRIGRKAVDKVGIFEPTPMEECRVIGVVMNKDRMNVSMRFVRNGYANLDHDKSYELGLPPKFPVHVFRSYAIIKDGHLNIDVITMTMDDKLFSQMEYKFNISDKNYEFFKNEAGRVTISLRLDSYPVVNSFYCQATSEMIYLNKLSEVKLESENKVVKYLIDKKYEEINDRMNNYSPKKMSKEITDQDEDPVHQLKDKQIEFLNENGITKDSVYNPPVEVSSVSDSDFYYAKEVSFSIKGMSSLPKVEDVINSDENKSNRVSYQYIRNAYKKYNKLNLFDLKDVSKKIKRELDECRFLTASIKIAKVMTGEWFKGFSQSDSDQNVYRYMSGDNEMIMKVKDVKQYL